MDEIRLTEEQLAVIHHPIGMHARVLAVAGSVKSFKIEVFPLQLDCPNSALL